MTVVARRIPCFFETLKNKYMAMRIDIVIRTTGSNAYATIFDKIVKYGVSIDCISVFVARSIVMLIVAIEY